jgi:hypothetical protein
VGSSVAVNAQSVANYSINTGAAAAGGLGAAGAFNVAVNQGTTLAQIGEDGDNTNTSRTTTVTATTGDISAVANSKTSLQQWTASGAAGGFAAAITAAAGVMMDTATARISRTAATATADAGGNQQIHADAVVDTTIQQRGGAISVSGGGSVSGSIGIALTRGTAQASIEYSDAASDGVSANALNRQDVDGISIGGAIGASGGIAGSLQLNMVGFGAAGSNSPTDQFTKVSNFSNKDQLSGNADVTGRIESGSAAAPSGQQAYNKGTVNAATRADFSGALTTGSSNATVSKIVGSNVTAAQSGDTDLTHGVAVEATSETAVRTIAGAVGAGGVVGAAGSIGVTRVYNGVSASIDANTTIGALSGSTLAPSVNVNALARDKAGSWAVAAEAGPAQTHQTVASYVAAGGLGIAGISVGVSDVEVNNAISAVIAPINFSANAVNVTARDESNATSKAYGVSAGGGAVGVSSSTLRRGGTIGAGALLGGENTQATMASLNINASEAGSLESDVYAGSGGVGFAVSGNGADVTDSRDVNAALGSSNLAVANTAAITATRAPQLNSQVIGVAISGGYGAGISAVTATLAGGTNASIGDGSNLAGTGTYTVWANNTRPDGSTDNVSTYALAAGGGVVVGAGGAGSGVKDQANVSAKVGNNVYLPDGDITIQADNGFGIKSFAASAGGGIVGVGIAVATADSTGNTTAELGTGVLTSASRLGDIGAGTGGGNINILAGGSRATRAYAFGGAGGVVAGAGSSAISTQSGSVISRIDGYNSASGVQAIYAGAINVVVDQKAFIGAATDSFQGSVLGASASVTRTNLNVTSSAEIGNYVRLAGRNITADATQEVTQEAPGFTFLGAGMFGNNAASSGYGLANAAGADSVSNINSSAQTLVGNGVVIYALGNPLSQDTPATLKLGAGNIANVQDSVVITTGGAVSFPFARTELNLTQNGTITVGDGVTLNSAGTLDIGTYSRAIESTKATVKVYGLAGLGRVEANTNAVANQTINVGGNASFFSWDDMSILTGHGINPVNSNDHTVASSADAFSGFTGLSDQASTARFTGNYAVNLGKTGLATLVSNRSINLGSDNGTVQQGASGSATSTLSSVFSTSNSNNTTPKSQASVLNLNINATAGARSSQTVVLDGNGNVVSAPSDVSVVQTNTINPYQALQTQIAEIQAKPVKTTQDNDQIAFLQLLQSNFTDGTVSAVNIGVTGSGVPSNISNGIPSGTLFPLWASGGNINITSGSVTGSGTLTANGGATISIVNPSAYYVNIGSMTIPDVGVGGTGGAINVSGGGSLPGSVSKREIRKDVASSISVNASYVPGPNETAPWILVNGEINNLAGLVQIKTDYGSIGVFNSLNAQSVDIQAPNGVVTQGSPNTNTFVGGNPEAMWSTVEYLPTTGPIGISIGDYLAGFAAQLSLTQQFGVDAGTASTFNGQTFFGIYSGGNTNAGTSGTAEVWYRSGQGTTLDTSNRTSGCGSNNFLCISNGDFGTYNYAKAQRAAQLGSNYNLGKTAAVSQSSANGSTGITAGTMALIQGAYINVNAPIRAGKAANYSVTINNVPVFVQTGTVNIGFGITIPSYGNVNLVDCMALASCRNQIATQGRDGLWRINGNYDSKTNAYTGLRATLLPRANGSDAPVSVAYDVGSSTWITDNVSGGGGGLVWLKGKIVSTNQSNLAGSINVNSGSSNVSVVNNTGLGLTLGQISPGLGSVGTIRITDYNQGDYYGNYLNTWYVSVPGETVQKYSSYTANTWQTAGAGTTAGTTGYDPLSGMRYAWSRTISVGRNVSENNSDNQPYQHWVISPWNVTSSGGNWTSNTYVTRSFYRDTGNANAFDQTFTLANLHFADLYVQGGQYCGSSCTYGYSYHQPDGGASRTWYIPDSFTLRSTTSVKADYQIGISFGGNSSGSVNVTSATGIKVAGNVNNVYGATSLTAYGGDLLTAAGITVASRSLTASASGSIYGNDATGLFGAVMGDNGTLRATANGDVKLRLGGVSTTLRGTGLTSNNGNIFLSAQSSVFGSGTSGNQVTGRNINLSSDTGGFGSSTTPLRINPVATTVNGAVSNGIVTAKAVNGIYLDQSSGDMRIGTIASSAGDVWLRAPGSVYAVPDAEASTRSDAELAALWDKLALTGTAAQTDANNHTVTPYVSGINRNYSEYWQLRAVGAYTPAAGQTPSSIVLSSDGLNAWRGRAAVALGVALPTDTQIQTYASTHLGELETAFSGAMGSNWATQSQFTSYNASYAFTLSAGASSAMTAGAVWNPNALANVINAAALAPGGGSPPIGPVTISGAKVNIIAGLDIGTLAPDLVITVPTTGDLTLTGAQKAALYRANSPGDVSLGYTGGALTSVTIHQVRPVVTASTQGLTVSAYGATPVRDLFIQTDGAMTLNELTVGRDARILTGNGVGTSTAAGRTTLTIGHDLTIDGGSAGVGSLAIPLTVNVTGTVQRAAAGTNLYMNTLGSQDLRYGAIYAGGLAWVHAGGSLLQTVPGISINAGSLDLKAGGSVGTAGTPIQYIIGNGGSLTAQGGSTVVLRQNGGGSVIKLLEADGGIADLRSVDGGSFVVDGLEKSTGNFTQLTTGDVSYTANGTLTSGGAAQISGNKLIMAAGSSMLAVNDASLAAYNGDMTLSSVTAKNVVATAFTGAITGVGNTAYNVRALGFGGGVYLNQANLGNPGNLQYGTGIGTLATPLKVGGANIYATTKTGNVALQVVGDAAGQVIQSANGVVQINGTGKFSSQKVIAGGGAINMTSVGDLSVLLATAQSTIGASSGGVAYINNLTAPNGATVTGTSVTIGNASVANGGIYLTGNGALGVSLGNFTAKSGVTASSSGGVVQVGSGTITNGAFVANAGAGGGTVGEVHASQAVTLNGGSWTIGTLTSGVGTNVTVNASAGGVLYDQIQAGLDNTLGTTSGDIYVTATGDITSSSGSLAKGRSIAISGTAAQLGNLTATGGGIGVTATSGDATAGTVNAAGAVNMTANRDVNVTTLNAAGYATTFNAGRYFSLGDGTALSLTGTSVQDAQIGTLTTGGALNLTSTLASATMASGNIGTTATIRAGTVVDVTALTTTSDASLVGGTLVKTGTLTSTGGAVTMTAGGALIASKVRSAQTARLTGTSLNLIDIATTGLNSDLYLTATTGGISYTQLNAVRDLFMQAAGGVTGGGVNNAMIAGRNITGSATSFAGAKIQAPGLITLTVPAGGSINYTTVVGTIPAPPAPTPTPPPPSPTPPPPSPTPSPSPTPTPPPPPASTPPPPATTPAPAPRKR